MGTSLVVGDLSRYDHFRLNTFRDRKAGITNNQRDPIHKDWASLVIVHTFS